jgi:hypothetical protein
LAADRLKIVDECHKFVQEDPALNNNSAMLLGQLNFGRA